MLRSLVLISFSLFPALCFSQGNSSSSWDGEYSFEQYGETLRDGSQVYIQTRIAITDNGRKAVMKQSTWHTPIVCDGDYNVVEQDGILSLNYLGAKGNCPEDAPQYKIKRIRNNLYIKGDIIIYEPPGWVKLHSMKK